jgi:hypothetical protein
MLQPLRCFEFLSGVDRREPYLLHLVLMMNFYVFEHLMNNVPGPLRGTVVFPYVDDMIIPLTTVKYSSRVCNGYDQFQRYYVSVIFRQN